VSDLLKSTNFDVGERLLVGRDKTSDSLPVRLARISFANAPENCIVSTMKRFTTATAKQRFSLLLDAAERGESVIIERRGVRFRVQPERQSVSKKTRRKPVIEIVDPAVAKGVWQWEWKPDGLRFSRNVRERR